MNPTLTELCAHFAATLDQLNAARAAIKDKFRADIQELANKGFKIEIIFSCLPADMDYTVFVTPYSQQIWQTVKEKFEEVDKVLPMLDNMIFNDESRRT